MSEPQLAPAPVSVRILERDYLITCRPEERNALLDSAALLNTKMKEIRESGRVLGMDRIAVMAALNLANEVLRQREHGHGTSTEVLGRVRQIRERVEGALEHGHRPDV